ncbi:MAG: bifunctional 5,10-methylenetetrahydrofolate dehydrogenase/5,10-methenyltetrahydrofolate cyclohydrolase, partial [Mycoplasmataceae bacterium]|nr:bifunctional 5,10-methylenetetrahydrofolate dehydrogenase/5,10-methenyltetrahydrofolate cyclohydrolase [Mycoplasmataceae bacterium]
MILLDGKRISNEIYSELQQKILKLNKLHFVPTLAIIQVGDLPASNIYIRNKMNVCTRLGFKCQLFKLKEDVSQAAIISKIKTINNNSNIHGLLVQLPLPKGIDENAIISAIDPIKDVDCFNLTNIGSLWTQKQKIEGVYPCTALGIVELLKRSKVSIDGKHVVIVGRSNIVGKPLAALMLLENATVTICHSHTKNLAKICSTAQILVVA